MKLFHSALLAVALAVPAFAQQSSTPAPKPAAKAGQPITVYRTATCGCCSKWVDHLKENGFAPTVHIVEDTRTTAPGQGVPASLRSCHNATLEGYTVEGHVPAEIIKKLLKERPKVAGIAVPGMPAGSPGMESPNPVQYDVIAYESTGNRYVYATVEPKR